jgi:hypothetical protein
MTVDVLSASTEHAVLDKEMANKLLDGYLVITCRRLVHGGSDRRSTLLRESTADHCDELGD